MSKFGTTPSQNATRCAHGVPTRTDREPNSRPRSPMRSSKCGAGQERGETFFFEKMSWRAASQIATTAGCLILRSTEMA